MAAQLRLITKVLTVARAVTAAGQPFSSWDCDGDGRDDCKAWDYTKARCANTAKCGYRYEFGDVTLDQSCRCHGPVVSAPNEYDCDGDGQNDCNDWDYAKASCSRRSSICSYQYVLGDIVLDQSCRCNRCAQAGSDTSFADRTLVDRTSFNYYARWRSWNGVFDTCAPWMMPTNDHDLRTLLEYAKSNGYVVRPSGATHSAGPLVTDGSSAKELVVSLAQYTAPEGWEYDLNEERATAVVNAGWSLLDLYSKIRPRDFFLPTQTAGPMFQIAGVIANSVHGGYSGESFLNAYVVRLRVMLHDGSIRVVENERELKMWRNSYGLLGLILSAEFRLHKRTKFQLWADKTNLGRWTKKNFWDALTLAGSANLSRTDLPTDATEGDRTAAFSEMFLDPVTLDAIVMTGKVNAHANKLGWPGRKPHGIDEEYQKKKDERVWDEAHDNHGQVRYNDAVRRWGAPAVLPLTPIKGDDLFLSARAMIDLAFSWLGITKGAADNIVTTNDGFFVEKVPNTYYGAYFLPLDKLFEAMTVLRNDHIARHERRDPNFQWNGPAELRFVTVKDTATLSPVPPGVYGVIEFIAFPVKGKELDDGLNDAFMALERAWMDELGGAPHVGKQFGFGRVDGKAQPFQAEVTCKVYSGATKAAFNLYRRQVDPEGLFFGGLGATLVSACPSS